MYKLSFLLHSLLDNGARMTPKCRSLFSLIFIINSISKFNLMIFVQVISCLPRHGCIMTSEGKWDFLHGMPAGQAVSRFGLGIFFFSSSS